MTAPPRADQVIPARARGGRAEPAASRPGPGPGHALARVVVAVLVAVVAFLASALYADRSPDLSAGEAATVQVARQLAGTGALAWRGEPVLDQPPLAPAAHGAVLALTGRDSGEVVGSIHQARLASSAFRALAVGLLVLLVLALTDPAQDDVVARFLVGIAAGLVAALDPVLVGAGRIVTVEALGLLAALLALWLAWRLRSRPAAAYVPVVGLASGAALLVDGRAVVLLVVPVVYGVLARGRPERLSGRALAALLTGAGFWAAFAAWSLSADPARAAESWPRRLAALVHLAQPDRPLPLGRPLDLTLPLDLATVAVLAAAVPALAALWRWRSDPARLFVLAWNLVGAVAGALLLARGALDETWLTYLLPGAVAAVALGFDAAQAHLAGEPGRHLPGRVAVLAAPLLVVALLMLAGSGWSGRFGQPDEGLARMSRLVADTVEPCSVVNASSPADPDLFSIGERRVAEFSSGPDALAHGVRYFLLRADDAATGRGTMSAGLAGWLRSEGRPVAAIPSHSHGSVELWQVSQPATSRVADLLRIPGGVFENTVGSACGGFPVVDGDTGQFFSGYQAVGGKPVIGRPLSRSWRTNGPTLQVFDTMMLGTTVAGPDGGPRVVRPVKLVAQLADSAPTLLAASGMPEPETAPATTVQGRLRLLTDPRIARFYLGVPAKAAGPVVWQAADGRYGSPVSRPRQTGTGVVRQTFERVVIEVDRDGSTRLAPIGALAVKAGLVPADALRAQSVPDLPPVAGQEPGTGPPRRLLAYLAAALAAWALLAAALLGGRRRSGRRGTPPGMAAAAGPDPEADPAPPWPVQASRSADNGRFSGRGSRRSRPGPGPRPPAAGDGRAGHDPDPDDSFADAGGSGSGAGAGTGDPTTSPAGRGTTDRDGRASGSGSADQPADRTSAP